MNLHTLTHALEIAPPIAVGNLTMHPLLTHEGAAADYVTLDEALASGFVTVTEVSDSGSVPELSVLNSGNVPVLLLDGEELVGAKQNRIVNLTILVPPKTKLPLPVTCVEAGRWAAKSRAFAASGRTHYASGRASKLRHVNLALATTGERHADQCAVWNDIDEKAARLQAFSETRAAAAMYEQARADLDRFQHELKPLPRQVGAVFAINGAIAGMELFDSPATWAKSMRKIVESYGLDALDRGEQRRRRARRSPERFLASLAKMEAKPFKAVGLGHDLRLDSPEIAGAGLAVDDKLVHLLAFAC